MSNSLLAEDLSADFVASLEQLEGRNAIEEIRNSLPKINANRQDAKTLARIAELVKQIETVQQESGTGKWFDPSGPFPIDTLPKHKAFFEAGLIYPERLFMAGNRCHAAGTRVWMADGTEKLIEDVRIGEKVLAYDIASHNLVETTVVDTFEGVADNVRQYVTPQSQREIKSTTDHPFLVQSQAGKFFQRKADELRYWDKVVVPAKWAFEGTHPGFSEDVAKLLGLLVGDGYLCAKDDQFKLTNKNEDILKFAEKVAERELNCAPRRVQYGTYTDLYFPKKSGTKGKTELGNLLIETGLYGTKSGTKFVPRQILLAPEGHVRAFVQGLLAADGHYRKGRITLYTTSPLLAETFEKACLRLSVPTNRSVRDRGNPNHSVSYSIEIVGDSNLQRIGDSFHKKIVLRGAERRKPDTRSVALKKGDILPKQEIYCITVSHPDHLFVANGYVNSNTGKSIAGCFELACHLTGEYPSWWAGIRFDTPIDAWAVGKDARAVRDTIQRELLGPIGEWGTGMISAHRLGKFWALQGTPQAVDMIKIKHKSGGWSNLGFKNYQQDIGSFMGTSRHVCWLDEECPLDIYNECNIRTATVNGIMLVTFTPLDGLTPMVVNFCKKADFLVGAKPVVAMDTTGESGEEDGEFLVGKDTPKAVVQAGWNDAPWLSEEMKARLLEDTPEYLRKARMEGLPAMGSGNVYPVNVENILIDAITIPDSWPRMFALDVGWNRTAVIWAALDPVTDTIYLYDEHYLGQEIPAVHAYAIKSRGEWIQGVFDPAARGRSPNDGRKLIQTYKDHGLTLFPADNAVDAGIQNVMQRLVAGKLKVFKHLINWQKEYLLYRRDKNGKIVKENDHLMDAMRYIINNMIRMSSKSEQTTNRGVRYAPPKYDV